MNITRKLQFNIFINTLFIVLLGAISYFDINTLHRKIDTLITDPVTSIILLHQSSLSFLSATEDIYSYNAFGDEREKDMFDDNAIVFEEHVAKLQVLFNDYEPNQKVVSSNILIDTLTHWKQFKSLANESLTASSSDARANVLSQLDLHGDIITANLERLLAFENAEINVATNETNALVKQITSLIVLASCLVLIASISISALVMLSITRPIFAFSEFAQSLGRGDFSRRITIPNKDELGTLATTINEMADNIQHSQEKLDAKIKERTAELEGKLLDLEKMNKLMIGREIKMVELKKEIQDLNKRLGDSPAR